MNKISMLALLFLVGCLAGCIHNGVSADNGIQFGRQEIYISPDFKYLGSVRSVKGTCAADDAMRKTSLVAELDVFARPDQDGYVSEMFAVVHIGFPDNRWFFRGAAFSDRYFTTDFQQSEGIDKDLNDLIVANGYTACCVYKATEFLHVANYNKLFSLLYAVRVADIPASVPSGEARDYVTQKAHAAYSESPFPSSAE